MPGAEGGAWAKKNDAHSRLDVYMGSEKASGPLHYGRGHANALLSLQPETTVASVTVPVYVHRGVAAHKDTKARASFSSLLRGGGW